MSFIICVMSYQKPVKVDNAGLSAQVPLKDVGPSCHRFGACF